MDKETKSLTLLKKYLAETPPEEVQKLIDKVTVRNFATLEISKPQNLQNEIKKWSDGTFGSHRTGTPIAHHLKKEIDEVIEATLNRHISDNPTTRKHLKFELADCLILLLDVAAHESIDVTELLDASFKKLEINKKRKWGEPDENGVFEHIPE